MRRIVLLLAVVAALLVPVLPAAAQSTPTVIATANAQLGPILTDGAGKTLYRFTPDQPNVSTCDDGCATAWPPLLLPSGDPVAPADLPGALGTITRADGDRQVTYNGMPLYYYAADTQPGSAAGQGVGGVWSVVAPAASAATPEAESAPTAAPVPTKSGGYGY